MSANVSVSAKVQRAGSWLCGLAPSGDGQVGNGFESPLIFGGFQWLQMKMNSELL